MISFLAWRKRKLPHKRWISLEYIKAYKSLATSYQEQAEFGLPVKGRFDDLPEYKQVCPCEGLTAKQRHDCTQLG